MEEGYTCMNGSRQSGTVSLSTSPSGGAVVAYSNQVSSAYLTPSSPTPTQPPQLPPFPAAVAPPRSLHSGPRNRNLSFPRADSGIEADSPRSPAPQSPSAAGSANPPVSALYEYINPDDVHIKETQHNRSQNTNTQGESTSSGISSAATVAAYSGDDMFDPEDGKDDVFRRRMNPMYEALEQSATRLYAEMCHCKVQSSAHRQLQYLWGAFIVMIVLVIFLLCVIAYILFMLVPGVKTNVNDQDHRLQQLETSYEKLQREESSISKASSMMDRISQLNTSVWMFGSQLQELSSELHQQISNISLKPGPQGPPGVGNLSMCYYTATTAYLALPAPYSVTSWMPAVDVLMDYMVMSASCGVIGGTQHFVEAQEMNPSHVQFRCRCDGSVDNYDRRACKIHLVLCPRLFRQNS